MHEYIYSYIMNAHVYTMLFAGVSVGTEMSVENVFQYLSTKKSKILISEMYTAYRVVCDPLPVGLTMREMSAEEDKLYSSCPLQEQDLDSLQTDLNQQVGLIPLQHLNTHMCCLRGHICFASTTIF